MPFGPIPVVGGAAGVAAFGQDQQAQQIQQQELLTRLIMQAQATQAQREWNQNYKEAQLASIQQARDEANANRVATRNENALKQIPGGQLIPSQLAGTPQAQDVSTPQMTLPASQLTGFSKIQGPDQSNAITGPTGGGATTGESQVQAAPIQPTGNLVKISSPEELNRQATIAEAQSRDRATAAQRDIQNTLAQQRADTSSDQGWQRLADATTRLELERMRNEIAQQNADPSSPKNQQKLEQQYRTVLQRAISSRSGGLGLENQKVEQANHLKALLDQTFDPQTGQWNIPRVQMNELALGVARLTAPGGQAGEQMLREFQQRTAKGDVAGALTYLTGQPIAANTQGITQFLKDSIDRQGQTAVQNREMELGYLRGLAPTDLNDDRRQALEAHGMTPLRQSRVIQNKATGERKLQISVDGGTTWQ